MGLWWMVVASGGFCGFFFEFVMGFCWFVVVGGGRWLVFVALVVASGGDG
jgi:hypothetical protein